MVESGTWVTNIGNFLFDMVSMISNTPLTELAAKEVSNSWETRCWEVCLVIRCYSLSQEELCVMIVIDLFFLRFWLFSVLESWLVNTLIMRLFIDKDEFYQFLITPFYYQKPFNFWNFEMLKCWNCSRTDRKNSNNLSVIRNRYQIGAFLQIKALWADEVHTLFHSWPSGFQVVILLVTSWNFVFLKSKNTFFYRSCPLELHQIRLSLRPIRVIHRWPIYPFPLSISENQPDYHFILLVEPRHEWRFWVDFWAFPGQIWKVRLLSVYQD